jgi:hypothetical protein
MDVMYAQSFDGSIGFSPSPTNATYYGLRNTNATSEDTNYTDYIWYETIGFGTTNFLWYSVTGGRHIAFYVGTSAPTAYYSQVQNNTPINLDILSGINTTTATIYIWGTTTAPARPTTMSTYTWSTGVISNVPAGWSTSIPADSTPGAVLWSITINLVSNNTQATSTLDWTNTSYPIVSTSTIGTPGSSTFVIIRTADDGSVPTNAEVLSVIGRLPVAGDIATLNYNSGNNSEVFTYTGSSWTLFQTYITGSLIVSDSITASNINSNGLVIKDNSGNPILGVGTNLAANYINPATGWLNSSISIDGSGNLQGIGSGTGTTVANNQIGVVSGLLVGIGSGNNTAVANSLISINANGTLSGAGSGAVTPAGINAINVNLANAPSNIINSNISINANGTLNGAGGGSVNLAGLGAGAYAYLNQITSSNISTYIAGAAIGTAQVGVLTAANIGVAYLSAISANMGTITAGTLAAGTVFAGSLSAATGTFAGSLSAATGTFAGSLSAATGSFAGSLSAATGTFAGSLSAATGTFAGTLSVGSSPAVSGTTMSGSGAVFNNTGTFAIGNSTTNMSFNGSQMTLNGNVVATNNINLNAVTNITGNTSAGSLTLTTTYNNVVSESFTTAGGNVIVTISAIATLQDLGIVAVSDTVNIEVFRDSTLIYSASIPMSANPGQTASTVPGSTFTDSPAAGSHTYTFKAASSSGSSNFNMSAGYMVLQEFKR